jgi:hypothetical protein
VSHQAHGTNNNPRFKKRWMVANQGSLQTYSTWKDETPKTQVDLVVCSVKVDSDDASVFVLTSPSEVFHVRCQSPEEAESWMEVIKKSIS